MVQTIEEIESCNDFVAALKSCTPFQGVYDLKNKDTRQMSGRTIDSKLFIRS
jgi:hypothetical protein